MKTNLTSLVLSGALVAMVGCALLPNTNILSNGGPKLNLGFAGTGYTTLALTTQASGSSLTFDKILFTPTKIEVHYAGALSNAESQATPTDIKGQDSDQSAINTEVEPATTTGEWIEFPVGNNATIDLTKLGTGSISFGESPLKTGKYDQIRLTGTGTYEGLDGSIAASGNYFLPSGRLYINQGFEMRDGYTTDLKFAFDPKTAMVVNTQKIILKPSSVKVFATYTKLATSSADASASTDASASL